MAEPTLTVPVDGSGDIDYDANCYVTRAMADDFFRDSLEAAEWMDETDGYSREERARALRSATLAIENLLEGQEADKYDPVDPEQPLMFPRAWDRDDSGTLEVPVAIERATYLLALHLLQKKADLVDADALQRQGIKSIGVDGLSVSRGPDSWSTWPPEVKRLVARFWKRGGRSTEGPTRKRRWTEGWVAQ